MELIPVFFFVGLVLGMFRDRGLVLAIVVPVVSWLALFAASDGALYGDGAIGGPFWVLAIGASVGLALLGFLITFLIRHRPRHRAGNDS